eukprot:gene13798-15243_t
MSEPYGMIKFSVWKNTLRIHFQRGVFLIRGFFGTARILALLLVRIAQASRPALSYLINSYLWQKELLHLSKFIIIIAYRRKSTYIGGEADLIECESRSLDVESESKPPKSFDSVTGDREAKQWKTETDI